jgi:hypothetical protein
MSKWKPITDKTGMKAGEEVLVFFPSAHGFDSDRIYPKRVYKSRGKLSIGYSEEQEVTHWRPMVKPPQI